MKRFFALALVALAFSSCADEANQKAVGPKSDSTKIPWNAPLPGQGGGQFNALPQNQYRR